jgi:hypothetical protein
MEVSVPTCGPRLSVVEDGDVLGGLGTGEQGKSRHGKQAGRHRAIRCVVSRAGWPPIATPPVDGASSVSELRGL